MDEGVSNVSCPCVHAYAYVKMDSEMITYDPETVE